MHVLDILGPIIVALVYISLCSLFKEPNRRKFNAVFVAGAGAAYLSGGGFGVWEFVFPAVITYLAYRGLGSYAFIGVAWLLHTAWDALHHLYGNPIVPFAEHSSLGCAICDPVIALWCFAGGPSKTPPKTAQRRHGASGGRTSARRQTLYWSRMGSERKRRGASRLVPGIVAVLLLVPVVVALADPHLAGEPPARLVATSTGVLALGLLVFQVVLPGRPRRLVWAGLMRLHRVIALAVLGLVAPGSARRRSPLSRAVP